jgi:hypothetical protein
LKRIWSLEVYKFKERKNYKRYGIKEEKKEQEYWKGF